MNRENNILFTLKKNSAYTLAKLLQKTTTILEVRTDTTPKYQLKIVKPTPFLDVHNIRSKFFRTLRSFYTKLALLEGEESIIDEIVTASLSKLSLEDQNLEALDILSKDENPKFTFNNNVEFPTTPQFCFKFERGTNLVCYINGTRKDVSVVKNSKIILKCKGADIAFKYLFELK